MHSPLGRALHGTLLTSSLSCSQEWGDSTQTWNYCPSHSGPQSHLCSAPVLWISSLSSMSAIFLKGFWPEIVPEVTLQSLSGPRVAHPIHHIPNKCGSLKQGDQGTWG